jgi:hypothetical protein
VDLKWFNPPSGLEKDLLKAYAKVHDPPNIKNWWLYSPVCREVWMKRGIKPLPIEALVDEEEDGNTKS